MDTDGATHACNIEVLGCREGLEPWEFAQAFLLYLRGRFDQQEAEGLALMQHADTYEQGRRLVANVLECWEGFRQGVEMNRADPEAADRYLAEIMAREGYRAD